MNARVIPKTTSTQVTLPDTDASLDLSSLNAHIAAELAAGLSCAADIRERYGISDKQWKTLAASPTFRGMLAEAVREMRGDLNAGARIQKKADIVLEDAIPPQARIDAGKLLAQLAGRTQKATEGGGGGGGFTLNINVGGREKLVIEGKAEAVTPDE
jgi:hypothetical protein